MLIQISILVISLVFVVWSADKFVYGAAALARNFGISPIIIGLTIVAMGTSAPEMMVAATASFQGKPDTAIGNAIGSNITNIALILGLTALFKPLIVSSTTLKRELPLLLVVTLIAAIMLYNGEFSFLEGSLLMLGFVAFIGALLVITLKKQRQGVSEDAMLIEAEHEIPKDVPTLNASLWLLFGIVLLPLSASWFVDSAVFIAKEMGVSDLVIGLTIIAIGTSLPELAASIVSIIKKEDDLALGNIIGSNIFNILAVLSLAGIIAPGNIDLDVISRDTPYMIFVTLLLLVLCFGRRGHFSLTRANGAVLLFSFVAYQYLIFGQTSH